MEHIAMDIKLDKRRNYRLKCSCGWEESEYYSLISGDTRRIHNRLNELHKEHMNLVFALK